jgi:hypothetical protein
MRVVMRCVEESAPGAVEAREEEEERCIAAADICVVLCWRERMEGVDDDGWCGEKEEGDVKTKRSANSQQVLLLLLLLLRAAVLTTYAFKKQ